MAESITIFSNEAQLEGLLWKSGSGKAGVVAHPHPMFCGTMENNVVQACSQALTMAGWTSLCFNFRGVGKSTGRYDQGIGEQQDIAAAVAYLKELGAKKTAVIGYSFGAWAAAFAWNRLEQLGVEQLILVAPPTAFMSFEGMDPAARIGLIVSGEHDEIAPPAMSEALGLGLRQPVTPVIIPGSDHFLMGREPELSGIIARHLEMV